MTAIADAARRLDPCVNWFKLLHRTHGRILWVFPAALFIAWFATLPWGGALRGLSERHDQRVANAPLLAEARKLDLSYETVVANPDAYAGKPVSWCLDMPSAKVSYIGGAVSRRVSTDAPYSEYMTNPQLGGYCFNVLAVVQGGGGGVVKLHVVGKL